MLGKMIDAGVNIFRLNMSHAKEDWVRRVVKDIRQLALLRDQSIGILMDTQGPAIRTGDLAIPIDLKQGDRFTFTIGTDRVDNEYCTTVNYDQFPEDVHSGDTLLVDNGELKMRILSTEGRRVVCEVLNDGRMGSRRHINLPGVRVTIHKNWGSPCVRYSPCSSNKCIGRYYYFIAMTNTQCKHG